MRRIIFIFVWALILSLIFINLVLFLSNHGSDIAFISTSAITPISTKPVSPPKTITQIPLNNEPTKFLSKNIIQDNTQPWGVAKQVGEHTWTMKIGEDPVMATPSEIFTALNNYRAIYGSQILTWDQKLADYAKLRANFFVSNKGLDNHQGFNNFLEKEDGFNKLGFTWLGENSSFGYQLNGVHVIEWIYAGDEPHNKNQLDNKWNYVGIGVANTATCLIFATGKI